MPDHKWVCENLPIERWEGNKKDGWRVVVRYGSYMRLVDVPSPPRLQAVDPEPTTEEPRP